MSEQKTQSTFDKMPFEQKLSAKDLDNESLDLFIKVLIENGKLTTSNDLSPDIILQRIGGVVRDANSMELVLNNGAVLFLGKSVDINSM